MIYIKRLLKAEVGDKPRNIGLKNDVAESFFHLNIGGSKRLIFKGVDDSVLHGDLTSVSGNNPQITGEIFSFVKENADLQDLLVFISTENESLYEYKIIKKTDDQYDKYDWLIDEYGSQFQGISTHLLISSDDGAKEQCGSLPLQRILYGAPGTGKSYSIKSAIKVHNGVELDMEDNRIFRTTFHPDYDYAQFVGCYKPTKENKKETEKQVILDYSSLVEKFKEYLAVQPINITKACTLFGYDYHDSLVKIQENGHTIAQILEDAYKGGTTYSSQIYAGMTVFETSSSQKQNNSSITYSFVPQVFTNALVKAYEKPDESVYLVIEEINRGNCAQIFGDIFQLLDRNSEGESEYSINVDEDLKQYLEEKCPAAITDGKIKLPRNFNIIATMNTSDQSLFPMDSAFKRRWEWEYVPVDYDNEVSGNYTITIDNETYNWHTFLKAINAKIKYVTKSEDKQMGNFFIKGNVDAKAFCNKVMFYLWNDVSKDYYESNDSLFQYIEDDSKLAKHFSFNELFGDGQTELLKGFMKFIGCDPVSDKSEEQKAKEEEESQANE